MVVDMFAVNRAAALQRARVIASALGRRVPLCLRQDSEGGSALVEFALVVPIFLIVVFGMCSFGILCNQYLELTEAVNVGAEQLSIARGNTTDPCNLVYTQVKQVSPALNSANMTFSITITSLTGTTPVANNFSTTTCTGGAADLTQGEPVTVNVQYPCTVLSMSFGPLYQFNPLPSCKLTAQITEITQ